MLQLGFCFERTKDAIMRETSRYLIVNDSVAVREGTALHILHTCRVGALPSTENNGPEVHHTPVLRYAHDYPQRAVTPTQAVITASHVISLPPQVYPVIQAFFCLFSERPIYAIAIFDHLGTLSVDLLHLRRCLG